ncbi:MAG: hypothetical protein PHE24_02180 [Patescibacteria group bacterium]|nr:hypothetical protein [Patescibacteria group bacterium]
MKKNLIFGLLAGLAMLVVGLAISRLFTMIYPAINAEYANPAIFRPWSDPLMSLYFLYPFVLGIILAFFWDMVKDKIKGAQVWIRGINFGLGYFVLAGIPGMLISYSTFKVSLMMIASWLISGLINAIIAGWIFAKWLKPEVESQKL